VINQNVKMKNNEDDNRSANVNKYGNITNSLKIFCEMKSVRLFDFN